MNNEQLNDKLNTLDEKVVDNHPDIGMKWDDEKKAYFPNIDDEFIYRYNLNYGFTKEESSEVKVDPTPVSETVKYPEWFLCLQNDFLNTLKKENIDLTKITEEEYNNKWNIFYSENAKIYEKKKIKMKKRPVKPSEPSWFEVDEDQIKHIYVENLPLDIKLEEFIELVSKCGMIMYEPFTNIPKAKLYTDRDGNIKGDGICCYLKVESVDLAIKFLDDYNIRGNVIKVSKAKFELKDNYVPKKRRKITNKEKRRLQNHQNGLFRWDPETKAVRPKKDCTVILKNAFDSVLMKAKPELAFDVKEKINKDAAKIGEFKSIQVHELHPEAVVQINFHDPNLSDIAVAYFNNKIWNGRKVTAEIWDGRTKYKVKETADEEQQRIDNWNKSLGVESETADSETVEQVGDHPHVPCVDEEEQDRCLKSLVEVLENNQTFSDSNAQTSLVGVSSVNIECPGECEVIETHQLPVEESIKEQHVAD